LGSRQSQARALNLDKWRLVILAASELIAQLGPSGMSAIPFLLNR
jgi:hypothetical protein